MENYFASGIYNPESMILDKDDNLWVVQNQLNIKRNNITSVGAVFKVENGKFYGYPFCYIGKESGTTNYKPYLNPAFGEPYTDEFCQDNVPIPYLPNKVTGPIPFNKLFWYYGKNIPEANGGLVFTFFDKNRKNQIYLYNNNKFIELWGSNRNYEYFNLGPCRYGDKNNDCIYASHSISSEGPSNLVKFEMFNPHN